MVSSLAEESKRLVDMEFRPGELPAAEPAEVIPSSDWDAPREGSRGIGLWSRLALLSGAFVFLLIVGGAAFRFASNAVETASIPDLMLLAGLGTLVASVLVVVVKQTRALRRLKSAERAREMAGHLSRLDGAGSGLRLLGMLRSVYADNAIVLGKLQAATDAIQAHHSDRDVIELLNRDVFSAMDREADERIQRAAIRASFGVSACPHPALDAVIVLGISAALIGDLMRIYGLRHSTRSLYRVMTRALFQASTTAAMSTVVEFAMNAAQNRIAAAVVGTAGEALIVARRMFTLGALAKAEIRPLPILLKG
jgi:putative membrane protein